MISVCLATYNGSSYVGELLHSVLAQLGAGDEIVVSDDGSSDGTLAVIAAIGDPRIRLLDGEGRVGVIKNFERALQTARGDTIFLCDQDDVWLPGKVAQSLKALDHYLLIVSDCVVVDSDLEPISPSFFRLRRSGSGILHNLWRNSYLGCCMAFRRELLKVALPFPDCIPMHDSWLGMIAETYGGTCFVPLPLLLYRRHGGNASDTSGKSSAKFSKMLTDRTCLASSLVFRRFRHWLVNTGC